MKTKLLFFLCLMTCYGVLQNIQAQIIIPYFPLQADDFGGSPVNDPLSFIPTKDNFTLEVDGTEGSSIGIPGLGINYEPTSTTTVRFVQKDGLVHVFESGEYKETITPNLSYAPIGNNLVENFGFETNTAQGSHRKDGVYWHVYNTSGVEDWAATDPVGSIRTTSPFSGSYCLLLRSGALRLTQNISNLKANTTYLITYKHKGNNANAEQGGVKYTIKLGSGDFGTGTFTSIAGHTTRTDGVKTWEGFEGVISTGETAPAWLCLERSETTNKFDWLDEFNLTEGNFTAGITGNAANVKYLEGSAIAPEFELQNGDMIDMTDDFVVNPNFNSNYNGWSPDNVTIYRSGNGLADKSIVGDGNGQIYYNIDITTEGRAYQIISGLPNGKYKLTMGVYAQLGSVGTQAGCAEIYANTAVTPIDEELKFYAVENALVLDGTIEIGVRYLQEGLSQIKFDNVKLYYLGFDNTAIYNALQELIAEVEEFDATEINTALANGLSSALAAAKLVESTTGNQELETATANLSVAFTAAKSNKTTLDTLNSALADAKNIDQDSPMAESVLNALISAIADAENKITNKESTDELTVALAALNIAVPAANSSIALFAELNTEIAASNAVVKPFQTNNGLDVLNAAKVAALAVYNGGGETATTDEEAKEQIKALRIAVSAYLVAGGTDVTTSIANPSFEETIGSTWTLSQVSSGWTDFNRKSNAPAANGSYFYNLFAEKVTSIDVYQNISLNKGHYVLSADFRIGVITDQHLYATVGSDSPVQSATLSKLYGDALWQPLNISFEVLVDGTTVKIGVSSTGEGTKQDGSMRVDNFKLVHFAEGGFTTVTDFPFASDELISIEYYTLQGLKVAEPLENGIYIVKKIYESKRIESEKIIFNRY